MKIVLAPDSFKGSLSALQVCSAMESGVRRVFPECKLVSIPLADGGEGTVEALVAANGGYTKVTRVRGPLDGTVEATWGILPDGKVIIEMAQASGLPLVPANRRDVKAASTYGTGQLIKAALNAGSREIWIGLGGSATTDGGAGAISALGAVLRDENDVVLRPGGASLANLKTIDLRFFDERIDKAHITVLCDVKNPLCGPDGAATIYGPQKGASPTDVEELDAALLHFAKVTRETEYLDLSIAEGAGAAGGLGFGLMSFCGAKVRSGIDAILEAAHFEEALWDADLILTGEGALDEQTLRGKTIAGVCHLARKHKVPVLGLGGAIRLSGAQLDELGLQSAFSIVDGPRDLDYCLQNAATLIKNATERTLRFWKK